MRVVIEDFESRVLEVRSYLRMLETLDAPMASIEGSGQRVVVEDGWRLVAKATTFLLLYNLVESAIRSGFAHLYQAIEAQCCTADSARVEVLKVWIDQRHRSLTRETASPANYKQAAESIVLAAVGRETLRLNPDRLPVSGNLDAQAIRELCGQHGILVKAPKKAMGGVDLKVVKDLRNALAHGETTFSECGRERTVGDLSRIADQVERYVRSVLRSLRSFMSKREYRSHPKRGLRLRKP